ncbi:dehydrodolichyl diphosphate synthase complex subunit Rer2p [Trichomonascus vanleenenianus]|uniref:undecaprenyl diphosphate synthase family protein n=1 Tax=Trichomonascus vanleenenianus TaxID=2268995 RepID=UPI003EC9F9C7
MSSALKWLVNFPIVQYGTSFFQDFMIAVLKTGPVPSHVAFVMDGNRRFAKQNQLRIQEGHVAGFESLMLILEFCGRVGMKAVTIYAFSIENFNRTEEEVDALLDIVRTKLVYLTDENQYAQKSGIKINVLGNREYLPADIIDIIESAEEQTRENNKLILNICFPYTSRDDITRAVQSVASRVERGELSLESIDMKLLEESIGTGESPPLDILVRTSGATRLSDFMLWESSLNCQIEFVETLWPDFTIWDMYRICIKWSYERTKEMKDLETMQVKRLPPPPPTVSVTEVDKSRAIK